MRHHVLARPLAPSGRGDPSGARPPGPKVLSAARAWGADLMVIGRNEDPQGRHGVVGAVALHVLELADVPVLLVP